MPEGLKQASRGAEAGPRLGRAAYAAQGLGLIVYVLGLWLEVYIDTRKLGRGDTDLFQESHRRWRLRTSLVFLTWTILGGLAVPFGIGWPVLLVAYLWYVWRVMKGWFYWRLDRVIGMRSVATAGGSALGAVRAGSLRPSARS